MFQIFSLVFLDFVMTSSKVKLKSIGDEVSSCCRPF
jgi:hypothetical protein